jgi:hypothetical protein
MSEYGRLTTDQMQILSFFDDKHLPEHLKVIYRECGELAHHMTEMLPTSCNQLTKGLEKLLEAKDCFIRARLSE